MIYSAINLYCLSNESKIIVTQILHVHICKFFRNKAMTIYQEPWATNILVLVKEIYYIQFPIYSHIDKNTSWYKLYKQFKISFCVKLKIHVLHIFGSNRTIKYTFWATEPLRYNNITVFDHISFIFFALVVFFSVWNKAMGVKS